MKYLIAEEISNIAYGIEADQNSFLDRKDIKKLREDGPDILKKVEKNIKKEKKNILSDILDEEKRVLLAYVVFFRQNLGTEETDVPNYEDAAKILHKEVFGEDSKKTMKSLEKDLEAQLKKVGIA